MFRRNPEELVWLVFVLVVGAAFAVSSTTLFAARLTAESHAGRFDAPYDIVWALCCAAMLFTLAYYVRTTVDFLRRTVRIDAEGISVGDERIDWGALVEVREQTIRKALWITEPRRARHLWGLPSARQDSGAMPVPAT